MQVTRVVTHAKYEPEYLDNDIALVQLSHAANFNYFVRPICLWQSSKAELFRVTDRYGTVVGWGKTEKNEVSTILREAQFQIVPYARCRVSNRDFYGTFLTETKFCAGQQNGKMLLPLR